MDGLTELATIYPNVKILHLEVDLRNNRLDFKVVFCTSNLFQGILSMDNTRVLLFVIFFVGSFSVSSQRWSKVGATLRSSIGWCCRSTKLRGGDSKEHYFKNHRRGIMLLFL